MTWFTETPWPPIIILAIAAVACLAAWTSQKRGLWLVAGLLAVAAITWPCTSSNGRSSPKPSAWSSLSARWPPRSSAKDREATLALFSRAGARAEDSSRASGCPGNLIFPNGIDIKDMHVRTSNQDTRAVSHFRANGVVSVAGIASSHFATRWSPDVAERKDRVEDHRRPASFHPVQRHEKMDLMDQRGN